MSTAAGVTWASQIKRIALAIAHQSVAIACGHRGLYSARREHAMGWREVPACMRNDIKLGFRIVPEIGTMRSAVFLWEWTALL